MRRVSQAEFYSFIESLGASVSSDVSCMSEPPVKLYYVGSKSVAKCCFSFRKKELQGSKPAIDSRGFESDWTIF